MNINDYKINENALCTIDINKNQDLFINVLPFENKYAEKLSEFKEKFNFDEEGILFNTNELGNLKNYIVSEKYIGSFDGIRNFKYCEDISQSYQGFEVNLEKETKIINDKINEVTHQLNTFIKQGKKLSELPSIESKLIRSFLKSYYKKIELWTKAYSINSAYKKCMSNPNSLYHSHRILGWSKPETKLHKDLSVEFKTNFGFGKSGYFFLKLKYKELDVVAFVDAIKYPYWNRNENVFYTRRYDLQQWNNPENKEDIHSVWIDAFEYTSWAVNLLNKNKPLFIEKVIVEELSKLTSYLENLNLITDESSMQWDKSISIHNDPPNINSSYELNKFLSTKMSVQRVQNPKVEELFQLCNTFNFLPMIEQYSELISVKSTFDDIYRLAKVAFIKVPDLIISIEDKVNSLNQAINEKKELLASMKPRYIEYEEELRKHSNKEFFKMNSDYVAFTEQRNKVFKALSGFEADKKAQSTDLNRCKTLFSQLSELLNN